MPIIDVGLMVETEKKELCKKKERFWNGRTFWHRCGWERGKYIFGMVDNLRWQRLWFFGEEYRVVEEVVTSAGLSFSLTSFFLSIMNFSFLSYPRLTQQSNIATMLFLLLHHRWLIGVKVTDSWIFPLPHLTNWHSSSDFLVMQQPFWEMVKSWREERVCDPCLADFFYPVVIGEALLNRHK